uniref:Carboxylic ester hydrolase n=1 Tax=Panonychus citri TaxID=50023 RepID=K9N0E8_PANCT|nr:esterase 4 [Panonychus citri]
MLFVIFSCFLWTLISANDLTPIVSISSGPVQGKFVDFNGIKVAHFLGVPYAKPPIKSLRFQSPEKVDPWTEVKSVTNYGASCPQRSEHIKPEETNEDCLFLNVYVTESTFNSSATRKRPVLFWIHGGALTMGSGNEFYPGLPMVPFEDVILVTHNYRLNAFGFMYFGAGEPRIPSNIGLRDQLMAMQWVRENIAKFGGDPNQVTIFGESAGSMSVSAHILSPLTKGLFKRAILESGTIYNPVDDPSFFIGNAWSVLNRTSCASSHDILTCLQGLSVPEIIDNQSDGLLRFRWVYGDDFLPFTVNEAFDQDLYDDSVDLLVGTEKNEFSIFMAKLDAKLFNPVDPSPTDYQTALGYLALTFKQESLDYFRELYFGPPTSDSAFLRSQLEKAYSDTALLCPTYMFGLKFAKDGQQSGKVFGYYRTQKAKSTMFPPCDASSWMGTCHAGEIPFVFGFPFLDPNATQSERDLSSQVMKFGLILLNSVNLQCWWTEWKTLNSDDQR